MFFPPYTLFDHMKKHAAKMRQSQKFVEVTWGINWSKVVELVSVDGDGNTIFRISHLYDISNYFIKAKEDVVNVAGIKNFTLDGSWLLFVKHMLKESRELLAFRAISPPVERLHQLAKLKEMSICSV